MKYLVTGGLGVIGSRFVEVVGDAGHSVVVLDAAEEPRNRWIQDRLSRRLADRLTVVVDRVERVDLGLLLEGADLLVHAAAHTGIPHSAADPTDDWQSNAVATYALCEAMRCCPRRVPTVMLSSVKPYRLSHLETVRLVDRTIWADPAFSGIDEECVLEPDEPYAASKMAQSALAMAYARSYNLPITVLRCSNLYGEAPCHGPRHGWLTWFCISAALGRSIDLQGSGAQTRDMLHADDVASAVLAAFDSDPTCWGNVYNIGGGAPNTVSCLEAVFALRALCPTLKIKTSVGRRHEDALFVTNHEKFSTASGWTPRVRVLDGIERVYSWACDHRKALERIYAAQT